MRDRRWLLALWLALILSTSPAFALDVLIVRPPSEDEELFEAFGRLQAELELQGFDVQVLQGSSKPIDMSTLELEAQRRSAFAAVALQRRPEGTTAEIHIVDRVTGKTTSRRLDISNAEDGPMLLAIRAADLLRASLLEFPPGQRPPEDVVGVEGSAPPQRVARFTHTLPRFQIGAGAISLWHPDLGLSFGGSFAFHVRPTERLRLGIALGGPAFGGEYDVGGDRATSRVEFAMASTPLNLGSTDAGPRWEWGPVAEIGGVHVVARGDPSPPLVGRTSRVWTLGLSGGAFVEAYFDDTVSLAFALKCLALFPQPVVAIDEAKSSSLGVQGVASLRLGVSF